MSLRQEVLRILQSAPEPLSENEIASRLKLPRHLKRRVHQALQELLERGQIRKNARHRFSSKVSDTESEGLRATFILTASGSAFAKLQDGREFFVPERHRGWALPGDEVLLRRLPSRGRGPNQAAAVQRVLKRSAAQHVGRLRREEDGVFVALRQGEVELDLRVEGVPPELPEGDWIVCGAPGLDEDGGEPRPAPFLSHLGGPETPHLDTLILIKKAGLKEEFSSQALSEAARLPADPLESEAEGRLDLRGDIVFTIDGADAKDFDDAVSIEPLPQGGWRLGVHIADVSHYVRPGTALDKEAMERATSVYLPDRVLPMLPEALSNGLCSLKPGVPRLTLSALLEFDSRGILRSRRFAQSVIQSARRFTYDEVQAWLDRREGLPPEEESSLGPVLLEMEKLARLRRQRREERGGLDFNFPEIKVDLDAQGRPLRLWRLPRLFSHQLIEEFMLAANEAVAAELKARNLEALFRIHEPPDQDKLAETLKVLGRLKLGAPRGGSVTPKDLQKILRRAEGTAAERFVHTLVLRSLKLARYGPEREMHFGLALEDYCHFTSPIRRYPDLLVHRALKAGLRGQASPLTRLKELGEHCSAMERKAEACERDCIKAKQMRYLESVLGREFDAVITSVAPFGFFAEIKDFPAEGLVPVGSLPEYFDFNPEWQRLESRRGKRSYGIGDSVRIRVQRADWEALQADFEVAE